MYGAPLTAAISKFRFVPGTLMSSWQIPDLHLLPLLLRGVTLWESGYILGKVNGSLVHQHCAIMNGSPRTNFHYLTYFIYTYPYLCFFFSDIHSQRTSEKSLQPWLIEQRKAPFWQLMAALGEACTLAVAALLFSVEATARMQEKRTVTKKEATGWCRQSRPFLTTQWQILILRQ